MKLDDCYHAYKKFLQKCGKWKADHVEANDGLEIFQAGWCAALPADDALIEKIDAEISAAIKRGRTKEFIMGIRRTKYIVSADGYGEEKGEQFITTGKYTPPMNDNGKVTP